MPSSEPITREFVRSILDYDPKTGIFTWLPREPRPGFERVDRAWISRRVGKAAGTVNVKGYVVINLLGIPRLAQRLAFIWMTGEAPEFVDHINRDRTDNRWANLRPATATQNLANGKLRSDNTSGYRGVTWYKPYQKWMARILNKGDDHFLGYYDTVEEAAAVYERAAADLFGEFHIPRKIKKSA
jgi:HNH endonuclease/AP2 domain